MEQPQKAMAATLDHAGIDRLMQALCAHGYEVIGPAVRDQAILYDTIFSVADLPVGWTDEQDGGLYRLKRRDDDALFGYAVGPHSWKKYLFPPRARLWQAQRTDDGFQIESKAEPAPRYAFFGVRPCDLHAIEIQDRVFLDGDHVDDIYKARRDNAFIIAVNCGHAASTCFCVSMGTGPGADSGYDLVLTEVLEGSAHYFLVETGSARGVELLADIPHREATSTEISAARQVVSDTAAGMGRTLDTTGIKEHLYANYEHSRWEEVATRCLSCANCTMVCPTCFCSTVEDVTDLTGEHAERWRRWDSCFTMDHSYIHGGSVRSSTMSRYRQWMTHKLATWIDQFGTSGCVGCGRCITWCPVGIDITKEVESIRRETHGNP
ncbi:MAG: 4Fe-4S dicluster domain-containing protein [Nitrospirota bacterium]|nr:4Fe-4S dicluster domain-containing protein [Nitrospirota bacterium]